MKKLAVCIPTYNRANVIEEFIEMCMDIYVQYDIDVYIYDSSEQDDTKDVVASYSNKYENLYYERIDSSVHSNMKVYNIYQAHQIAQKYEYLWVCSDAIRWKDDVIFNVSTKLEECLYDMVIVNYRDVEKLGNREYTIANELFNDCAWHMTLYGATIVKINTVLKDVNWEYLIEKYCIPQRINHSHVALYFEQIDKMNHLRVFHFSIAKEKLKASQLRNHSGWYEETFSVWCEYWPSMINALPNSYKNKKDVIKKHGKYSEIITIDNLIRLRELNIYNWDVFLKYRWRELVDIHPVILFVLLLFPVGRIYKYKQYKYEMNLKNKIKKFSVNYDYIYIYGCGKKAMRYVGYLNSLHIPYQGFFVSDVTGNVSEYEGHKVIRFEKIYLADGKTGILMGINKNNYDEIVQLYPEIASADNIFTEYR